jgi:hypothetical protein
MTSRKLFDGLFNTDQLCTAMHFRRDHSAAASYQFQQKQQRSKRQQNPHTLLRQSA